MLVAPTSRNEYTPAMGPDDLRRVSLAKQREAAERRADENRRSQEESSARREAEKRRKDYECLDLANQAIRRFRDLASEAAQRGECGVLVYAGKHECEHPMDYWKDAFLFILNPAVG